MTISKEDFARGHLRRMGNDHPSDAAIEMYLDLIETDNWVKALYERANIMTAEVYNRIATIEPDKDE